MIVIASCYKLQNRSWDAKVIRGQSETFLFKKHLDHVHCVKISNLRPEWCSYCEHIVQSHHVYLVSDFNHKPCHIPLTYKYLFKKSDCIRPTYLMWSVFPEDSSNPTDTRYETNFNIEHACAGRSRLSTDDRRGLELLQGNAATVASSCPTASCEFLAATRSSTNVRSLEVM